MRALVVIALFAALWLILFRQLSGEWSVNDQYSYGWFVPFFTALLFWLRWEDQPKVEPRSQRALAIVIAIAALLLLFPIRLFEIANPDWRPLSWLHAICVITITLVFFWRVGGTSWLRHFAFPILFVLVAVPWITPIEAPIIQGLMRTIAAAAAEIANLLGIPAQVQGNLIRVPNGLVGVNEACSGVRSLQTSLMIGLLFGELKRLSMLRRVILVAGAVAIALIANLLRAVTLVWIGATEKISAIDRWHDAAGYAIVACVFIGALVLTGVLGRPKVTIKEDGNSETRRSAVSYFHVPTFYFAAATCWILLIEIAAAQWYRAHERNLVEATRWEIDWPTGAQNFRDLKIDKQVRTILRFDRGHAASWTLPVTTSSDGTTQPPIVCTLYFFQWNPGKNSALLANLHRPDVCLPAIGWNQIGDSAVENYSITPELSLPFRDFEFRHGASNQSRQVAHAFYCLWEDRVRSSQPAQMSGAPSEWTRSERLRAVLDGRRHLGQQVMELIMQTKGDIDKGQIDSEFQSELPKLIKVEARK